MTRYDPKAEIKLTWAEMEKRIRQMIAEGSYLTQEEIAQPIPVPAPEAPPPVPEPEPPAPAREITQVDIDTAIQEWNGDMDSKRRVQQYMTGHGREKGTADWLRGEYGDDLPAFPVTVEGAAADLPWPKVQRHLARLVKENRFFTEAELENFEDIDPAAIREQLEQAGERPSPFMEQVMADVERLAEEETAKTIREVFEKYKPVVKNLVLEDTAYQNACRNSDRETAIIEGDAAVKRAALTITEPEFMRLYYDMPDFRYRMHREVIDETYAVLSVTSLEYDEETPPWGVEIGDHSPWGKVQTTEKLADGVYEISTPGHGGIMVRETDAQGLLSPETIAIGGAENGWCYFEEDAAAPVVIRELLNKGILKTEEKATDLSDQPSDSVGHDETASEVITGAADRPPHDPFAPLYNIGDTVYLDKTAYEITDISLFDIQLRDPALPIPLLRSESKKNFERLLLLDARNEAITQYLPADLDSFNEDFREVLTSHLLTQRDKDYISGWLRSGENNRSIGNRLSQTFASRAERIDLETGDVADYFTSTVSMQVEIQDKFGTKQAISWEGIAPVLRALWLQDLDGFSRAPVQRRPVHLEGKLSYQEGDKVSFQYGDHDVSGTISHIGKHDVLIYTGPYAWSNQTVSRDFFEEALRQDERNAHLFVQEPEQAVTQEAKITTIYPGDKNGLPFDVIVQRLPVDEPAQTQPEQTSAGNFRITDDHLGMGGPKAKFRMNMDAINTLQGIELEGRSATPEEQEILSRYVGWGALADAFDPDKPSWTDEYLELKAALTPAEYEAARTSVLNSHYARFVL